MLLRSGVAHVHDADREALKRLGRALALGLRLGLSGAQADRRLVEIAARTEVDELAAREANEKLRCVDFALCANRHSVSVRSRGSDAYKGRQTVALGDKEEGHVALAILADFADSLLPGAEVIERIGRELAERDDEDATPAGAEERKDGREERFPECRAAQNITSARRSTAWTNLYAPAARSDSKEEPSAGSIDD